MAAKTWHQTQSTFRLSTNIIKKEVQTENREGQRTLVFIKQPLFYQLYKVTSREGAPIQSRRQHPIPIHLSTKSVHLSRTLYKLYYTLCIHFIKRNKQSNNQPCTFLLHVMSVLCMLLSLVMTIPCTFLSLHRPPWAICIRFGVLHQVCRWNNTLPRKLESKFFKKKSYTPKEAYWKMLSENRIEQIYLWSSWRVISLLSISNSKSGA